MERETSEGRASLAAAWRELLLPWAVPDERSAAAFTDLAARYGAESRAYHNLDHLSEVLAVIARLASTARDPMAVRLAAWFHDSVYDSRAGDNEERSAELAATVLSDLGLPPALVAEVTRLVLLTKGHVTTDDDRDGQLLLDADLSVLGAEAARYDAYARAIRREYAWVAEDAYRAGRARVLEGFLGRPHLYFTAALRALREGAARRNLQRELILLRGPAGGAAAQVTTGP